VGPDPSSHGFALNLSQVLKVGVFGMRAGANYLGDGHCEFAVWAPFSTEISVVLLPERLEIPLLEDARGYWRGAAKNIGAGAEYFIRIDGNIDRPDPASHFQPHGVHEASRVVDHESFCWEDEHWRGIALPESIIYELHVGTFTREGTFDAAINRLDDLRELGVTTIELMPVAQFPGDRNWGYDGVHPYAPQNSYGGPDGLKRLVNACHVRGMAVFLDVVYNHLGPEGNYLRDFGPYYTDRYQTPWGEAVNFDGLHSDGVREFFLENALFWFREYHLDGLRLDAVHAIHDLSPKHFLRELSERVSEFSLQLGRKLYLVAESDLNDARLVRPTMQGGYGLDAQWADEFHHSLRALLTGERGGYYEDFGELGHLAKAYERAFVYAGEYSIHRKCNFGDHTEGCAPHQFIVFTQNHDQVGNHMMGARLSTLIPFEAQKLAAGAMLLSPYVPMLFMGEEYGEERPFLYFVSHSDASLQTAVREGRKSEFKAFRWQGEPPDPNDTGIFERSKLAWEHRDEGHHGIILKLYRRLLELRRALPSLRDLNWCGLQVSETGDSLIVLDRRSGVHETTALFNFADSPLGCRLRPGQKRWVTVLDSAAEEWAGPGTSLGKSADSDQLIQLRPQSFVLFERQLLE
jgi:maltooligosyltrehalose trehalohydrolase